MKKTLHKFALLILLIVGAVNSISATNEKYAVIINGGGNSTKNYVRYWNDCAIVYLTLRDNGYLENNIYVAMSGYYNISNTRCHDFPFELNNYNEQNTITHYDIEHLFSELSAILTGDDDLFIYVTGPGYQNATTGYSYIDLWEGDSISDYDFTALLAHIQYRTLNIVMQQSYAGGFIDDLMALDNVVITTACNATEKSWAKTLNNFSEFTYRWVSATYGDSPYNMISCDICAPYPDLNHYNPNMGECIVETYADLNGDGYVTMKEAFNYAEQYDHSTEQPQIESNPGCLSRALALNELLYNDDCSAALIEGWDLYIPDNTDDDGAEPNLSTNKHWLSPNIWFEKNGVTVNTLEPEQTYDVCVRVENRKAATSPDSAVLYVHWTKSRIGGKWPEGWNGGTYDCDQTPVLQGDLAGSIVLPPIEGGQTFTARIPWTTPSYTDYSPCLEHMGHSLIDLWHFCVLARIVDSQEQPDETITNMDFQDFVLGFNNVASRNVTVLETRTYDNIGVVSEGVVGIANPRPGEDSGPYTLKFDIERVADLDYFANVTLTFPSWFYNTHYDMTWQNCNDQGYGNFTLADNAQFDNIYFTSDDNYFYPLVLDIEYIEYNPNLSYDFDVNLTLEDASGVLVGGEQFQFRNNLQYMANSIRARDIQKEEGIIKDQEPIIPDEILYVDIYNAQGQLLMRSSSDNIESLNLPQGIYILRKVGETQSYSIKIIK